ncbi:phosphoinositide 3-kinase adapter protein 1 isoform X2 [Chrysoperla carnea]|uniref:phosphoinositide 3-kinase adapter protein 1 isoform X2 n=1 Tax=Chrysoperla carnea TaxID=189513 RepID=UPI001D0688AF|nr:phosphoinositide 3-kinase adapter protein 1 isoform X2 [Chrysoperla carnea]
MALDNPSYFSMSTATSGGATAVASGVGTTNLINVGTSATLPSANSRSSCKFSTFFGTIKKTDTPFSNNFSNSQSEQSVYHQKTSPKLITPPAQIPQTFLTQNSHRRTNSQLSTEARIRTVLLRSVSANSTESNQELLILGEPRPSDIAPSTSFQNLFNFNDDDDNDGIARQSPCSNSPTTSLQSDNYINSILKSSRKSSDNLIYSPLPTTSDDIYSADEDSVFLNENSVRYYNLTSKVQRRRHSFGAASSGGSSSNTYFRDRKGSISSAVSGGYSVSTIREIKDNNYEAAATGSDETDSVIIHATANGETIKPIITTNNDTLSRRGSLIAGSVIDRTQSPVLIDNSGNNGPFVQRNQKKCHRCTTVKGGIKINKMCNGTGNTLDDIVIIFSRASEVAGLWAPYLSTCFDQISQQRAPRHPFKVLHMSVEEINDGVGANMEERLATVKLQIIIICPTLINTVNDIVTQNGTSEKNLFNRIFQPDRTLGMLLGVTDDDITDKHKSVLSCYHHWKRIAVKDQDPQLVGEFLDSAMTIISRIARQQYIAAQQEKSQFSVVPKKVKTGQRRVIVLLNDPLQRDDIVKVSVDKSIEMIEVSTVKRRNPYTLQFSIPESCLEVSMMINVVVEKNGSLLGSQPVKCESRLRELDQLLRSNDNPIEFMCQTLGFSSTNHEQLDNFMVHAFQRNLPPHFNLLMPSGLPTLSPTPKTTAEEYPTLLHFAAKFGLEKLAWQLLECPGGEQACEIRNFSEMTPAEIAENSGHLRLAQTLRGYMQMNEFSNMYHMLKGMSEKTDHSGGVSGKSDEYLLPRPVGETYSVPPSAKPFSPPSSLSLPITGYMEMNSNGKQSSAHTPSPKSTLSNHSFGMLSNSNLSPVPTPTIPLDKFHEIKQMSTSPKLTNTLQRNKEHQIKCSKSSQNILQEDHVQAELAEIINEFKNNVFTIQEVEQLVENWKNRNDVQQSFRDKHDALIKMREEYERIQKLMKESDNHKTSTPFDRLKRFFSRNKTKSHNDSENSSSTINHHTSSQSSSQLKSNIKDNLCQNHRPVSSLSQSSSSSSSSARMSTASGCSGISFGDSGTHSDVEERKHLFTFHSNLEQHSNSNTLGGSSNYNYLIPPAPKPVFKYGGSTPPAPGRISPQTPWKFKSIDESNNTNETRPNNEYYIQFPPSGMPVSSNFDGKLDQIKELDLHLSEESLIDEPIKPPLGTNSQEYINISAKIAQKELLEDSNEDYLNEDENDVEERLLPEYMNFQPVNSIKKNKSLPPNKPKRNNS